MQKRLEETLEDPRAEEDQVEPFGEPMPGEEPEPEPMTEVTLQSLVNRMIELQRKKRERKDEEDRDNAEMKRIEPIISQQFAARQIQQQKNTDGVTVFLQREIWASLVKDENGELEDAHQALRDNGLAWLVNDNVNGQKLSAWVREQERQETEIPKELLPFLKISKPYRVKVRL